jgi:hypothetical protein
MKNSFILPLVFSNTLDALPERRNEIPGLMAGFAVPGLCMIYILFIASRTSKAE